jgi:hypothetical protein
LSVARVIVKRFLDLLGRDLPLLRGEKALAFVAGESSPGHAKKISLSSPEGSLKIGDKKRAVTSTRSEKSPLGVMLRSFSRLAGKK